MYSFEGHKVRARAYFGILSAINAVSLKMNYDFDLVDAIPSCATFEEYNEAAEKVFEDLLDESYTLYRTFPYLKGIIKDPLENAREKYPGKDSMPHLIKLSEILYMGLG
jgi:hypothetical protein